MHEKVKVTGMLGDLRSDLLHYPYKGTISGLLQAADNYSGLLAEDMHERGKRYHLHLLLLRPMYKFIEVYFFCIVDHFP